MKKKNLSGVYALSILLLSCSNDKTDDPIIDPVIETCEIIDHGNPSGTTIDQSTALDELEDVYEQFETHIREKDIDGLNGILLHEDISLFITGKRPTEIEEIRLTADAFRRNVSNTPGLELRISDTDFTILNGAAISWANFEEVTSNGLSSTGVDLFFYINTEEGWKLSTTNNTYIRPNDDTNYETEFPMATSPEDVIDNLALAFNEKNENNWRNNFKGLTPFIVLSSELSEAFSTSSHTANSFMECLVESNVNYSLTISNATTEVQDQYLAATIADYIIDVEGEQISSGKIILTMIGAPQTGWKVSAGAITY